MNEIEEMHVKIAIPSTGKTMESQISQIFGRCPFYILVEVTENEETGEKEVEEVKAIENPATGQRGGAGVAASQALGNEDVDIVLAFRVGPRAFDVLDRIGIKIYQAIDGTAQDNIAAFISQNLEEITEPGKMGMGPKPGAGRQGRGRGRSELGRGGRR